MSYVKRSHSLSYDVCRAHQAFAD